MSNLTNNVLEEYIEEHNLQHILTEMLNTVVYEKPRNPSIFMVNLYLFS